jgi:N-acetylated-alpha-linked acidic dipeptidase
MLYAPGRLIGYGAKTLPGVREAIEDGRWDDVETYTALSARALQSYADGLDEGLKVMGR